MAYSRTAGNGAPLPADWITNLELRNAGKKPRGDWRSAKMKRSEINARIRDADAFFRRHGFRLPPFAYWTPADWARKGPEAREIVERQLGWDITDFGSGDFERIGLFLFTLRNGALEDLRRGGGKVYAEKLMIVGVGQVTPRHFHWTKVEDILNRGGGNLVIELHNATPDEKPAGTEVRVSTDGVERRLEAGGRVVLGPGESITLPTRMYHQFWGEGSRVLVGEVSAVNDDHADNRFLEPCGRFPAIEEDEAPLYPLCSEYRRFARF
jgi:D-lyxose ketol-isomerase